MTEINLSDGKYTVVNELGEGGGFKALRYGEEWRNLAGGKLVMAMAQEIEELREQVVKLTEENNHHIRDNQQRATIIREWSGDYR